MSTDDGFPINWEWRIMLSYGVFPDKQTPDVWRAEAVDHDNDGCVYVAVFSGPEAERMALEYADYRHQLQESGRVRRADARAAISAERANQSGD